MSNVLYGLFGNELRIGTGDATLFMFGAYLHSKAHGYDHSAFKHPKKITHGKPKKKPDFLR